MTKNHSKFDCFRNQLNVFITVYGRKLQAYVIKFHVGNTSHVTELLTWCTYTHI